MLELISSVPLVGGALTYVIPFLVLLTAVVFVHELGHYLVARWCGVRSQTFSVGFGPELFGWTDSHGTRWRFSWIPLGGYVRFAGDEEVSSTTHRGDVEPEEGAFFAASLGRRTAIVSAGPIMNFIFAAVTLAVMGMAGGLPDERAVVGPVDAGSVASALGLQSGDHIESIDGTAVTTYLDARVAILEAAGRPMELIVRRDGSRTRLVGTYELPARVGGVLSDSPAEAAGLQVGDTMVEINGQLVTSFYAVSRLVRESGGGELAVVVERAGEHLAVPIIPELREVRDPTTGELQTIPMIGVRQDTVEVLPAARRQAGLVEAVTFGVQQTVAVIVLSLDFVAKLFVGASNTDDLGGPIAIAEISGEAAQQGVWNFVYLLAIISASIGLINLFPIPVLDGGHLLLYAIEGVRGKPLGERTVRIATQVGLCLVLLLMAFVTYNDLLRL